MAFPIPSHLPRKAKPLDVSSQILNKIGETSSQSLTVSLATSWLTELDASILATKRSIYERISADLSSFERQLSSARAVQERLQTLSSGVEKISNELEAENDGVIPQLSAKLSAHSHLAQQTNDAAVKSKALKYLQQYKTSFNHLSELVKEGQLPEAMTTCKDLDSLLQAVPAPLLSSRIYADMKAKFRATRDRAQEQLSDAYSRIITITSSELTIQPSIQVRQSETVLSLTSILESLPSDSLSAHLTTLRKNLTTHYLNLAQPISITISSLPDGSQRLLRFPSPPQSDYPHLRIQTLAAILEFLSKHLFPYFPDLPPLLCKSVSDGILNDVLVQSLPSRFNELPTFLDLVRNAVSFEEEHIVGTLRDGSRERPIKSWSEGVSGHYERNRRVLILASCRDIVCKAEELNDTFIVEQTDKPPIVPVQEVEEDAWGFDDAPQKNGPVENAWGFEEEEKNEAKKNGDDFGADDAWGFDDDVPPAQPKPVKNGKPIPLAEPDPANAWGWNENEAAAVEDDPWDDPWNDPPPEPIKPVLPPSPPRSVSPAMSSPRPAAGLAKFASKGRKSHLNGESLRPSSQSPPHPVPSPKPALGLGKHAAKNKSAHSVSGASAGYRTPSPFSPVLSHRALSPAPPPPPPQSQPQPTKRPPKLTTPTIVVEKYVVSGRMREILHLVQCTIDESKQFSSSDLFPHVTGNPGSILRQCADSVVDLYKAIYPVKFATQLSSSIDQPIRFSNDCIYLAQQLQLIEGYDSETASECRRRLKVLGDCWFDDTIHRHRQSLNDILAGAHGFNFTADQEQYDECENAVNQVLKQIRNIANKWKPLLTKTRYYTAIGSLTDAALSRVLDDVLALPDIPEVESHRIGELCRIFNALEGLFVEDAGKPSVVVAWVPSWLKFSYLSELLEASMADITYLFEEGALVDFEIDELTSLVKALFADTPLRTNTLNRIMGGHPVPK